MDIVYKRILLKLSGEALSNNENSPINDEFCTNIATVIKKTLELGCEIGIVVGGGNFWRGRTTNKMNKSTADYMGMFATIMNSLAIRDSLYRVGVDAEIMSALDVPKITQPVDYFMADKFLKNKKVVIFAGGTGSPFFTTDTAAVLRAIDINADAILLAKSIDYVYSSDPKIDKNAIKYDKLTYKEMINKNLKVIDMTAATLCEENNQTMLLFSLENPENIIKIVGGQKIGTILKGEF